MAQRTNTDTGKPAGNAPMQGTGVPQNVSDENSASDDRLTEQYTNDDDGISDGVREMHPNRNVDKVKPSGGGSYQ